MNKLHSLLLYEYKNFQANGIEAPQLSVELLLAHALKIKRSELLLLKLTQPDYICPPEALACFKILKQRRFEHEPVAYILGCKEFYGRNFKVSPATLIPRPDTELLINTALVAVQNKKQGMFADLGTGSGCIALTLAAELPGWHGHALDISAAALEIAQENALALNVEKQIDFFETDFTTFNFKKKSLDLLLSNPPYISESEYATLEKNVREFEPKTALVPGNNGTEHLLSIIGIAGQALKPGAPLILEIGCTQGAFMLSQLKSSSNFVDSRIIKDLAGLDRVVFTRKCP